MPTIEESAAAFRAGQAAFKRHPGESLETAMICEPYLVLFEEWLKDYSDGWRSAQREAEVERHIDEGANGQLG